MVNLMHDEPALRVYAWDMACKHKVIGVPPDSFPVGVRLSQGLLCSLQALFPVLKEYIEQKTGAFDAGESEAWTTLVDTFVKAFKDAW